MRYLLLEMLAKLTSAYNKNPDGLIGRLFSLFATSLWGIEDTLKAVALWRDIDSAKGTTLDRIGMNLGVKRDSAPDLFFRIMIKVKMLSVLSGGDVDTVIRAVAALFNLEDRQVELREVYPAKVWVILEETDVNPWYLSFAQSIVGIIKRVLAAGIGKRVFLRTRRSDACTVFTGVAQIDCTTLCINPRYKEQIFPGVVYAGCALIEQVHLTIHSEEE